MLIKILHFDNCDKIWTYLIFDYVTNAIFEQPLFLFKIKK